MTTIRYSEAGLLAVLKVGLPAEGAFEMLHNMYLKAKRNTANETSEALKALREVEHASVIGMLAEFVRVAKANSSWSANAVVEHVVSNAEVIDLTPAVVEAASARSR